MDHGNIFESIIDNMVKDGYLEKNDAASLKTKYVCYVNNLEHLNNSRPAKLKNAVQDPIPEQPKQLSKEQIRERNLSWKLNIGVILLLLSGLIFATTTWSSFNNIVKVCLLFCVSLFFFGVSIFSKNFLKIYKTSNAFWILGSLFLPLSLLSIGFFKLLGSYYSIFGEGRYVYGVICTFICLPVFSYSTIKYKSRIFSWITLSIFSLLFAFAVASFYPPHLVLVLILFGFNALLLLIKEKVNSSSILKLFFKELGIFIQFNLLLTMVLTMTSFSTDMLYSINLLILSLIVFALSITEKQSVYDYLSALIFCFGICLLGKSLDNYNLQLILIASVGIVFSAIAFVYKNDAGKHKRYSVLSAIASAISFLYIAVYCISMNANHSIIYVGLACLVVLILNNIQLYIKNNLAVVGIFIPFQIFVVIYEFLFVIKIWTTFNYALEYLTIMTLLFFAFAYGMNNLKRLEKFAESSAVCSLFSTLIILICCSVHEGIFVTMPITVLAFALQIFVLWLKINIKEINVLLSYLLPLIIFGALCLIRFSYELNSLPEYVFYFSCALMVYCLHFAAAHRLHTLKDSFFYCGHFLLLLNFSIILSTSQTLLIQTVSILLMCMIYLYSIYYHRKIKIVYLWLNALLITFTILLFDTANIINTYANIDLYKYVLYLNGFLLIFVFNFIRENKYKQNIAIYLSLLTVILIYSNLFAANILWYEYLAEVLFSALMCVVLTKINFHWILFIPLLLYISAAQLLIEYVLKSSIISIAILLAGGIILLTVGRLKSVLLFSKKNIDYYSLTALLSILLLPYHYSVINIEALGIIIPGALGSLWFLANRNRIFENDGRLGGTLFAVSLLWPFYSLMSALSVPNTFIYEVCFLPIVVLTYVCVKWIYRDNRLKPIEYIIPVFCYTVIIFHLLASDNILEAIIIGGFGLLSLLYGSLLQTKSALFMGGILIILTAVIKSRDFWLSVQWWIYLAIIGGALVITASINEYEKNKNSKGILPKFNKLLEKFSEWD